MFPIKIFILLYSLMIACSRNMWTIVKNIHILSVGPVCSSHRNVFLRPGRSGVRILVEARFSATIQTDF